MTYERGEKARYSKLTETQVKEIRRLYLEDVFVMHIARDFGVCPKTVRDIVKRRTWTHV